MHPASRLQTLRRNLFPGLDHRVLVATCCVMVSSCDRGETAKTDASAGLEAAESARSTDTGGQPLLSAQKSPQELISEQIDRSTTAEFAALWASINSSEDLDSAARLSLLKQLVAHAFENNNSTHAVEAIVTNLGPGRIRSALLQSAFTADTIPFPSATGLIDSLDSRPDKISALTGVSIRIAQLDDLGPLTSFLSTKEHFSQDEIRSITRGLAVRINPAPMLNNESFATEATPRGQRGAIFDESLEILRSANFTSADDAKSALAAFLELAAVHAPEHTWALSHQAEPGLDPASLERVNKIALKYWMRLDPKPALDSVLAASGTPNTNGLVKAAISEWIEADVSAPYSWFTANKLELSPEDRDQVVSAFGESALYFGELDTAWKWVKELHDPSLRKEAEGQVWQAEKKQITQEARRAPQQTVESLVSGDSVHETYWLQAATDEWLAKDPGQAREWYDANSRSLSPEQNEHIAMAYARKAIKDGDKEAAAQWATQVLSDERKAKLMAEINQATKP